jgi:hypothetical protein
VRGEDLRIVGDRPRDRNTGPTRGVRSKTIRKIGVHTIAFSAALLAFALGPIESHSGALLHLNLTSSAQARAVRHGAVGRSAHVGVHHTHVRTSGSVHVHGHVHRGAVVVAPVRPLPAVRPWYWGRAVAGVTIGTVIAATAVGVAPVAPSPTMCWIWTDNTKSRGYWDYCVPPK